MPVDARRRHRVEVGDVGRIAGERLRYFGPDFNRPLPIAFVCGDL